MHLSVQAMLSSLVGIDETLLVYTSIGGRPRARLLLTEMDDEQCRLSQLLGLSTSAPKG
jgi:hypothetical protein